MTVLPARALRRATWKRGRLRAFLTPAAHTRASAQRALLSHVRSHEAGDITSHHISLVTAQPYGAPVTRSMGTRQWIRDVL